MLYVWECLKTYFLHNSQQIEHAIIVFQRWKHCCRLLYYVLDVYHSNNNTCVAVCVCVATRYTVYIGIEPKRVFYELRLLNSNLIESFLFVCCICFLRIMVIWIVPVVVLLGEKKIIVELWQMWRVCCREFKKWLYLNLLRKMVKYVNTNFLFHFFLALYFPSDAKC